MHAACLKSAAVGPWAGRYTDSSGARRRLQKWPKTLPQCNMKMHQKRKNRQKSAKIIRKIDFPYNDFPKKGISLRKCTPKKKCLRRKKSYKIYSRLRRYTAAIECCRISGFWDSALIPKPAVRARGCGSQPRPHAMGCKPATTLRIHGMLACVPFCH